MGDELAFTTGRCVVRELRESDAEALARQANNRNVWLNLRDRFPHPYGLRDAQAFIAKARSMSPPTHFGIEVQGQVAGAIAFELRQDVERFSAEIGYWLAEALWGRGIMTDALRAATAYAFGSLGLKRVYAMPFATNRASARVLEKAGYRLEGVLRRAVVKDSRVLDQLLYAITDEDFRRI
jgi:RimJ/RimL family protein N-acetyltransferase